MYSDICVCNERFVAVLSVNYDTHLDVKGSTPSTTAEDPSSPLSSVSHWFVLVSNPNTHGFVAGDAPSSTKRCPPTEKLVQREP